MIVRDAPTPVHSLEARYYIDPAVFERERTGLFSRTWQFAGHESQARNPGDYVTAEIAGENVFCMRGRDGVLRSFYNVCQHRAHPLLQGAGRVRAIVCPYHAWSYELDGTFRSGPNVGSVPGFDASGIRLTPVRTETFHGFVFVNLDEEAAPMDEWYPGVREELAAYVPDIGALEPLEWLEVPERCNWKVSVENYSECYHCTLNHPTFATGVVRPESYDIRPSERGYVLRHTSECQDLERMSYPVDLSVPHAGAYRSFFLWPAFSFQVYPGNLLNTYLWRAHDADNCTVWRGWYTPGGAESETVRRLARQDRETTVAEDLRLVESVAQGLKSRGYRPGPLVLDPAGGLNAENAIRKLQQWMREAVEGEDG